MTVQEGAMAVAKTTPWEEEARGDARSKEYALYFANFGFMDPNLSGTHDFTNGFKIDDGIVLSDPNQYQNLGNHWDLDEIYTGSFVNYSGDLSYQHEVDPVRFASQTSVYSEGARLNPSWSTANPVEEVPDFSSGTLTSEADPSLDDTDFSETAKYISQMLMEENFEQKPCMFYDPLSLKLTEKSFYDAIGENCPLSPNQHPLFDNDESPDGHYSGTTSTDSGSSSTSTSTNTSVELRTPSPDTPASGDYVFQFTSQPISQKPFQPPNAFTNGLLDFDSSITKLLAQNIFSDADSVSQFNRGLEEARKFLPKVTGLESKPVSLESKRVRGEAIITMGKDVRDGLKSRKNHEREGSDDEEEGRSNKQSAVYVDESEELSEMFDKVLLSVENVPLCAEHNGMQCEPLKDVQSSEQPADSSDGGGKTRSKKQGKTKETVDLRTLLVLCAQSVSANDRRTANELLKQIRQHSSPFGDGSQRVAHYFANGLEARLIGAGAGTQLFYNSLSSKRISAADMLKAYQVSMTASPFKKFANFFNIKMIMKAAEKAETLHIVDFGILYGYQWPMLIKFLSSRDGGPPKLRITGIEFPQPGFRPAERIEETGRRLGNYCKRFSVPFEYKAIASQNWDTISIEDLKVERNEVLAVNCLMRFKNLLDETIEVSSPRNVVLNLIRKMNPDIFVQSILNGSYNAPFFVTRFREALFHFSALYDMFDTMVPRENEWRLMLEREFYGREAMNVVACEGLERVERPETYKQWQVRVTRAGFKQLPLNKELMAKFRNKMEAWYHKDFVFDEDNNWMIQGWKGRILYASTCWVPA
ncbi:scarecrow-like protein 14 [Senna tora]|uniref:Scarecrow-like protein 14 n=1 Tax=Senna tora TaxID=362788 RepID=A0A834TK55_9FABA|nr:scarecrow-like protein 14 [Senna tora]